MAGNAVAPTTLSSADLSPFPALNSKVIPLSMVLMRIQHGLWPQEVVRVVGLHVEVCGRAGLRVKVCYLRGEKRGLPGERHVARVGHLFGPCEL